MLVSLISDNIGSLKERKCWMSVFEDTKKQLLEFTQRTGDLNHAIQYYAPVWIPDNFSENCMICDARFSFYTRRHHCR